MAEQILNSATCLQIDECSVGGDSAAEEDEDEASTHGSRSNSSSSSISGSSTTTDSDEDSAEERATSSSESRSSGEEDEDENENTEYMVNVESPNALVRFVFFIFSCNRVCVKVKRRCLHCYTKECIYEFLEMGNLHRCQY